MLELSLFWLCVRTQNCAKTLHLYLGLGGTTALSKLRLIYEALGQYRAAALPELHTLSGSGNTGSFVGKGNHSLWKAFQDASETIVSAMVNLGTTTKLNDGTFVAIEQFIQYLPQTHISEVKMLRWWLFKK